MVRALVNGSEADIYLTLSFLDVDGKPRYRYAPGHPNAHEVIEKGVSVEILGVVDRFADKALISRK